MNASRNQKFCVLCRYWNGTIGSLTIDVCVGAHSFQYDRNEIHSCFKQGRGMKTSAIQSCQYFLPRYEI